MSGDDRAGEFGPIYLPALQRIRDLWIELEPLVDETSYDDVVAPTELRITLSDGLGDATSARFDIQWSELGMYSFHYVDSDDVNWRFDRHPNTHSPEIHFHPPRGGRDDGRRAVLYRRDRGLTRDACCPRSVASSVRG